MKSTFHCRITSIALGLATFILAIQAFYWPYMQGPQGLRWWQISWMAEFGLYIGLPVMIIAEFTGSGVAAWIVAILWAYTVSMLVRTVCRKIFD